MQRCSLPALLLWLMLFIAACRAPSPVLPPAERPRAPEPGLRALLLNGGGSRADNFHSHLVHIRDLVGILRAAGVPHEHMSIVCKRVF